MFITRDGKCKKLNAYKKVFIHLIMKFLYGVIFAPEIQQISGV